MASDIVTELEAEVGVRRYTYLFGSWFAHDWPSWTHRILWQGLIGPVRSNRDVLHGAETGSMKARRRKPSQADRPTPVESSSPSATSGYTRSTRNSRSADVKASGLSRFEAWPLSGTT
jgi:hypothetical protein